MNLKQYEFPVSQYMQDEHPKKQIYIHHTAGNASAEGVFRGWMANEEKIATCVAISGKGKDCVDGQIIQGFPSSKWAYHLGLKADMFATNQVPYISLDKFSIGIEICNWGQLSLKEGKYYTYVNSVVPADEVCVLEKPYKGYRYFHNYTDAQIESTKQLLLSWKEKYNIPLTYNEDIWDITKRALKGEPGVYTHNSVRKDKVDIYPHPKMIAMLKSL
jgi:N-acetyl-anhydromuramyl-L-alanine amidase AmpD